MNIIFNSETEINIDGTPYDLTDPDDLALAMLQWGKLQRSLNDLAGKIEARILEAKETLTVGKVRCTYSKPSRSFDHQGAVSGRVKMLESVRDNPRSPIETQESAKAELAGIYRLIKENTPEPRPSWSKITKALEIPTEDIPYTYRGESSATLKLLD